MRYLLVRVCPWLLIAGQIMAADPISDALQRGLFEEEANHNLEAAIKAYQSVIDQTAEQRKLTANAVFRLGECYRKLNKTNEAVAHYQRLTREFPDQLELVNLSQQNLLTLSATPQATTNRPVSGNLGEQAELNRLRRLAKDNPDLLHAGDDQGDTPLHKAASRGYVKAIEFLLANKADVNAPNRQGATPLHYAVLAGHQSIVELLLAKGADVKVFGSFKHEDREKTNSFRGQALHMAVSRDNKALVELLLKYKADVNGSDGVYTPLRFAIEQGYLGLVRLLLSKGANVNLADADGVTPAMKAAEIGHENILRTLIESGADLNARTRHGRRTTLHFAAGQRSPGVLKALLERNPDLEITNALHETPLLTAVKKGYAQPIELLLQAGANPNFRNEEGSFPLFAAVWASNIEAVRLLLAYKADPKQTNLQGMTALNHAIARSLETYVGASEKKMLREIADLLQQSGGEHDRRGSIAIARNERQIVHGKFLRQDARQLNRFTLFELLHFIYVSSPFDRQVYVGYLAPERAFAFPDFARIKIDRLVNGGKEQKKIELNLEAAIASGDCSKDVPLEWGDIVEIPEKDHPSGQPWPGLPPPTSQALGECLIRSVTLTAKGETKPVHLHPMHTRILDPGKFMDRKVPSFRLKTVLSHGVLLGGSFDLKQVIVVRKSPETGEDWKVVFNAEGPSDIDDLHLRNGDAIYLQ